MRPQILVHGQRLLHICYHPAVELQERQEQEQKTEERRLMISRTFLLSSLDFSSHVS